MLPRALSVRTPRRVTNLQSNTIHQKEGHRPPISLIFPVCLSNAHRPREEEERDPRHRASHQSPISLTFLSRARSLNSHKAPKRIGCTHPGIRDTLAALDSERGDEIPKTILTLRTAIWRALANSSPRAASASEFSLTNTMSIMHRSTL